MGIFPSGLHVDELNSQWVPALDQALGLVMTEIGEKTLTATFTVSENILQPFGIMHGGVSCVIGESLGSIAGGSIVSAAGKTVVGQSLYALHLRPAKAGMRLAAVAEPIHIGSRSHIWEIRIAEVSSLKPISQITLTLAVIDKPQAQVNY